VPAPFSSKYVDIDGSALHYLHTGPTTLPDMPPALDCGTLFLLIHGGGRNAGDWKRQLTGLGARHSVVAPDLPAHGRSCGIDGLPAIEAYADVVDRFAQAVLRRKPVLVGWSMGFSIALTLAARDPIAGVVSCWCRGCRTGGPSQTPSIASVTSSAADSPSSSTRCSSRRRRRWTSCARRGWSR
jgi:pimeloyl-ACP methyl ester carboxylesterase